VSKASAREAARLAQVLAEQHSRRRRTLAIVAVAIVVALIAGGIGFQAWRAGQQPDAVPSAGASPTPVTLVEGQPVVFGSADAPVQIDLYADFHCPGCAQFEQNYSSVLGTAQQRGQAAIRFFPLSFHDPGSVSAGNGFACAAEAGFGQSFFTGLFANASLGWSDEQLNTLAERVAGAPPSEAFRSCVTGRAHEAYLASITAAADQAGVNQTPTVLLNGTPLNLADLSPDQLAQQIDAAAAQR
jgi:protein-disulfide isomerase